MLERMNSDGISYGTDYGVVLCSLGDVYYLSGDYQTALPLLRKGLKIIAQNEGKESPRYGMGLFSLSRLYTKLGEYEKALPLAIESLKIKDWEADTHDRKLVKDDGSKLIILADLYSDLGNHPKALSLSLEALKVCEANYGKEYSRYGYLLGHTASKYANNEDYNKALSMSLESLAFTENNLGKENLYYGTKLGSLSRIYFLKGDYKKSLSTRLEAVKIIEDKLGIKHPRYAEHLSDLATLFIESGDYKKAIPLLVESLKLKEETLGVDHHSYGASQFNLAKLYYKIGEFNNAIPLLLESNKNLLTHLDNVFKFRSEKEKKMFLETVLDRFDINQSIGFQKGEEFKNLVELNLNNQLILKNLLLKSSKDISAKLATLNFSQYDKKITIYRYLKQELSEQLSLSMSERKISVDSLINEINIKESELVKLYNSNFQENINISKDWKLSNQKLKKNEIAIEFSHYKLFDNEKGITDKTLYGAYIYKKDWEYPKLVSLFNEEDLKKVLADKNPNQLYNSDQLYNLIWKPLEKEIKGSKTIYYSPSGLLNQISFSAMESDCVQLINSTYNLVRLSSTSVLEHGEIEPSTESTLFIGAIEYDYLDAVKEEIDSMQFAYLETESIKNYKATRNRGETWEYLPGTEKEIKGLHTILRSNGKSFNTLKGSNASEAKFNALSGNSPSILHIATHGFFFENLNVDTQFENDLSKEDQYRLAEDPLLRSGLVLAGANYAWKNGSKPEEEEEDGILNAMEISNLDLSNTNMVVLSACETGLGDIDGSEGVYGLQRAFKMAGVDIIVMSLWKVPDAETAEFMNAFYENWLGGDNVKLAFNNAQRMMHKKYKNEPLKWAAFVLFE